MKQIKNGLSYEKNGWLYVSVKGNPKERGYAYGYLIADEMKKVNKMLEFVIYNDYGRKWEYFIEVGKVLLKEKIMQLYPEFYEEMLGVSEGLTAAGTKMNIDEIIAWNNYFLLTDYWYPNHHEEDGVRILARPGGEGGAKDRCSAFIANGDWTKDGKIVVGHNNFSNFVDGQFARIVLDINPTKGARMLIQGFPGWIWSGTDFFVTSKGIIGAETTIGGFLPYENNLPISCRIRQAMQYGNNLDDYVKYLVEGNSGDYANSWLFGDINTNEILRLELGLKYHNVERTKNGYFIGFNGTYDPQIRNLECVNQGFDDIRRHQGARRVRLDELMDEHKGKLDIELAKIILADHYDVYLNKENPCSRTVCSHYELDAREYMSDPSRPKPFQPRGAIDGNVCDTNMAKHMSFCLRYGDSCGKPFWKDKFCDEHRQWAYLRPYLNDRPQQPWTYFSITKYNSIKKRISKRNHMNKSKQIKYNKKILYKFSNNKTKKIK
jgi:hypothetical protein